MDRSTCGLPLDLKKENWPRRLVPLQNVDPQPPHPQDITIAVLPDTQYYTSCREKHFAAQTKYVISYLRFFVGARAHPVIAALSSGVPTVSIAYSVKACGINRDLFGNQETVLQARNLSCGRLQEALERLVQREDTLRSLLEQRTAEWQLAARAATARISDCLC